MRCSADSLMLRYVILTLYAKCQLAIQLNVFQRTMVLYRHCFYERVLIRLIQFPYLLSFFFSKYYFRIKNLLTVRLNH